MKFKGGDSDDLELESNSSAMSNEDGMKVQDLTKSKSKKSNLKVTKKKSMIKGFRKSGNKFKKK